MKSMTKELLARFEENIDYPNPTQDLMMVADFAAQEGWPVSIIEEAVNMSLFLINNQLGGIN